MRKCFALLCLLLTVQFVCRSEKTSVFFVHGANVSERDVRAWADEMFKRLWQAGAQMEFFPVAWESDYYTHVLFRRIVEIGGLR